jgi:hypothetical protein
VSMDVEHILLWVLLLLLLPWILETWTSIWNSKTKNYMTLWCRYVKKSELVHIFKRIYFRIFLVKPKLCY